ncbi:gas vesicle structural protein GvpA [Actinospica sp. MGRD01-02]|uniref:Gas vesicle protein A n=1 Tax=Actinospica acidithermotolerans TaxID=2828514 RepID=A0A941EF65_9ACTN|nr:gas vesicle protein GvpJ [Actinospica acidithermotolerans]MBR7830267.1 gas vesicle structural protein GvpA [Actinospica acidithermotolerans]
MTMQAGGGAGGAMDRPSASGLADVIDTILDKGLVIDAFVRVSLVGIELLTVDARIVVASVDTYLRFAEAANRLNLEESRSQGLPDLVEGMEESGAKSKTKGALQAAEDKLGELVGGGDEEEDVEEEEEPRSRRRSRR